MSQDDSPPLTRDIAPFGVRMPPALKERVQASAKANGRSMNAEIVHAIELYIALSSVDENHTEEVRVTPANLSPLEYVDHKLARLDAQYEVLAKRAAEMFEKATDISRELAELKAMNVTKASDTARNAGSHVSDQE